MGKLDFATKTGWPASATTFEFLQNEILLLQQMSLVNGLCYIINGCTVTGGNVSDGFVVVNGEVLPFVGGAAQTNVAVVDTVNNKTYKDLQIRPYYHERYATFASTGTLYAWADFERNDPANGILKRMKAAETLLASTAGDLTTLTAAYNAHTHTWASITGKPNSLITYAAIVTLGDVGAGSDSDTTFTIDIPNQGDNNYIVLPSLISGGDIRADATATYVIGNQTANQFKVVLREVAAVIQNFKFGFAILKLS